MDELTGRMIGGRYRVESFEGHGGMANVYKVWDSQRSTHLAMKVLHSELAEDRVFLRRFKREGQMLEQLQHPNIVRFYGLEESEGLAYILMDFIEGLTLRREIYLNIKGIRPARVLQIMQPVCAALHYAHLMGMVHCDLKPVNIIIHRNGTVYLTDFGIARVTGTGTQTALVSGTPAYIAPEQILGEEPSPASDIYALGVVLFEMLTGGERPFSGESVVSEGITSQRILWEKTHLDPPPPSRFNRQISPELEAVTLRCLERDPNARFGSTLELSAALEQAIHGRGENYDIQTLADIHTPPREGSGKAPFLGMDDEEFAPAGELPERQPGTYNQDWPEPKVSVETPAAGNPDLALALAGAAGLAAQAAPVSASPRRARPANKTLILSGLGMFALLMLALALFNGRPETISPVSAAATAESTATLTAPVPTIPATSTQLVPSSAPTLITATPLPSETPLPQPTLVGGGSGKIAFASDRSGTVQVWMMHAGEPDERQQITDLPAGACQPAWAPDGKRIAFITPCNGPRLTYPGATIQIIDLDTGALTDLKLPGSTFDPAWAPDGQTIAYTTYVAGKTVISAVRLTDLKPYLLVDSGEKNENPDWSPDGEAIAYISDNKGVNEIWVMDKDGGSQEMVTQAGLLKYFSAPEWAPDGQKLAAGLKETNLPAPVPVLALLDRYNGRAGGMPLLAERMRMEDGAFSPDGQWLAFWSVLDGGNMEILRVSLAGEVEQLTDHTARDFQPDWSWR